MPKTKAPKFLNDFQPVAFTSLVMKIFEKIIKDEILGATQLKLDPLQFAYRAGRGVENATGRGPASSGWCKELCTAAFH